MIKRRWWIALMAIPLCLAAALAVGAQRSHPTSAGGGVIDPTCTSSSPCIEYDNTSTGPGVKGTSAKGRGVIGVTSFNSTSSSNESFGVYGGDSSTSGTFNSGVRGFSPRGNGVSGQSTSGDGVFGSSARQVGVYGTSTGYLGVFGTGPTYGVAGVSTNGVGVYGTSNTSDAVRGIIGSGVPASFHAGVAGLDSSSSGTTNEGVYGQTNLGIGVQAVALGSGTGLVASSASGLGANIVGRSPALSIVQSGFGDLVDACLSGTANPCDSAHAVVSVDSAGNLASQYFAATGVSAFGKGNDLFDGFSSTGALLFYVTNGGDVFAHSFTSGLAATRIQPTATGRSVRTYSQQSSQPSLEDFGEAQLSSGQAYVRLSSDFANVIEKQTNYLVFITPEGDSRGLYVTQKSAQGFGVRENMGGQSTLAFSYRIVAKPLGSREPRLPMVTVPKTPTRRPLSPRHPVPR